MYNYICRNKDVAQWLNWIEQPPPKGSIKLLKLFYHYVFMYYYYCLLYDSIFMCIVLCVFVYGFY